MHPALIADTVMRAQHGLASRAQLRAVGLGERTISRLVGQGELERLHRGVYGVPGWPMSPIRTAYAAQLAAPSTRAAAAAATALEAQGIEVVRYTTDELLPAEVLDPAVSQRRRRRGLVIHPGELPAVVTRGPVRACAILPALGQLLCWGDPLRAIWACEYALREGKVELAALQQLVAGLPYPAAARLARVNQTSESPLETWIRVEAAAEGVTLTPQIKVKVGKIVRVDLGIEALRIGWEADGRDFHPTDGPTYFADRKREKQLRAAGWEIHRICWSDMLGFRDRTISEIRSAIALRQRTAS